MRLLKDPAISRRTFIRVSALAGGGLLVACGGGGGGGGGSSAPVTFPDDGGPAGPVPTPIDPPDAPVPSDEQFQPHAYIRIASNNVVTILVGPTEIGQGVSTSIPQIVADELDADWSLVTWEPAPVDPKYGNPIGANSQITAASVSVRGLWHLLRDAGAQIRLMLIDVAATEWGVDASSLRTELSFVIDDANNRRMSYGELADGLAGEDPTFSPAAPTTASTKTPDQFTIIGQSMKRLDGPPKAVGAPIYGLDMEAGDLGLDELPVAVVARPPRFGDQLQAVGDTSAAEAVPGVLGVFQLSNSVAVLAVDFWTAERARELLNITWNSVNAETLSSVDLPDQYNTQNMAPGLPIRSNGFVPPAGATLTQNYFFPFLGHAPMEPLNVIINFTGSACDIWMGSQWPDLHKYIVSTALGLPLTQVNFNVLQAGGGFGRRANISSDLVQEAAAVAQAVARPVKIVWSREDDIRGGYYRPAAACRMEAFISGDELTAWGHRVASQPVAVNAAVEAALRGAGGLGDEFVVTGLEPEVQTTQGGVEMPYDIANVRVDQHSLSNGIPVLWVRSVANSTNVYAVETFFDLACAEMGRDPLAYRQQLLATGKPRHLACVNAVANALGWTAGNTSMGLAVFNSYDSVLCTGIEVTVSPDKEVSISRVVSAVDVGIAVNPDLLIAQIESGIVFGLSTIMFGEITFDNGFVQQSNYDDFRVMRMFECPPMETLIIDSGHEPGGAGELGVPCAGPALANAIFAATGEMITSLPMVNEGWTFQ